MKPAASLPGERPFLAVGWAYSIVTAASRDILASDVDQGEGGRGEEIGIIGCGHWNFLNDRVLYATLKSSWLDGAPHAA